MAKPNFENLKKALLRQGQPESVPCWELFADKEVMEKVMGEKFDSWDTSESQKRYIRQILGYQLKMGYDYLAADVCIPTETRSDILADDTAMYTKGQRSWVDDHNGLIQNWDDFEKYPWPSTSEIDYTMIETASRIVPEGMKVMLRTSGVLENVQWLMGYERMSYALFDEPELVTALFERIGSLLEHIYRSAAEIENVSLFAMGDDMGFKTSTLFSPDVLREHVFPWQKKCVEAAHSSGGVFIMHSCGNLDSIMDDLIDDVEIDAKHSFEDVIQPVEEVKKLYGQRVALIGGVDIDLLSRGTEEDVRKRTRQILEACVPGGGYVAGTGNSVANYISLQNFLAMMDEVRAYR